MQIPPYLKASDSIYLLSTARKISTGEIQYAIDTFTNWGFNVIIGKTIGADYNQFAGDDDLRLEDIQTALDDDAVKAIFCVRGGYGTIRIIDEIDFRKFSKHPKWICGYSDITILHNYVHSLYDISTLHCTMPFNMPANTALSIYSIKQALTGEPHEIAGAAHPLNRAGHVTGRIIGGNLSLLHTLSGTTGEMDTMDNILFIEDTDEYLYHIDRMMWQLNRSGRLENLIGLVVGSMSEMKDNAISYGMDAAEIIHAHVKDYRYPVCFNMPVGHDEENRAFIHGGIYEFFVDEEGGLLRGKMVK